MDSIGWYCHNSGNRPHPVGGKAPNDWGLYDMAGNVSEWVWDADTSYNSDAATDPIHHKGFNRVNRGGGWYIDARSCRSAARRFAQPRTRSGFIGFRLVINR